MRKALQSNPNITSQLIESSTKDDFRAVMKQILQDEIDEGHISKSIESLRDDPDTYNRTMLGWAKFVYPQEKKVDINVEVREKQDMYASMYEQYGNSLMVEDAEVVYDEQPSQLSYPDDQPSDTTDELDPTAVFAHTSIKQAYQSCESDCTSSLSPSATGNDPSATPSGT